MPRQKMVLLQAYVTAPQSDALKTYGEETGLPQAEILRRAVTYFLEAEQRKQDRRLITSEQHTQLATLEARSKLPAAQHVQRAVGAYLRRILQ